MAIRRSSFARARRVAGHSQESLAEHLKVDRTTVARWEAGEYEPQPWQRPRIAEALGLSLGTLNELLDEPEPAHMASQHALQPPASRYTCLDGILSLFLRLASDDSEDSMERRAFILQAALLTALGTGGTASALEALRHELHRSLAEKQDTANVDEWQRIVWDYGQAIVVTAPRTLLPALMVDLQGVQHAIQRQPDDATRQKLLQAGALLAAFTASTVADLGNLMEAQRWWRTARLAADEVADPWTFFAVRGHEVAMAGYERRPVGAILELVHEAEARLDEAPPGVLPGFFAGKAQTLALAGRHGEAEQALRQVHERTSKLPSIRHMESLFAWAEENTYFTEAFVYSHAGNFAQAERSQQRTLALYSDATSDITKVRNSALIELLRSLCLVRGKDTAQGVHHAQETITSLPMMHRDYLIANLGQTVLSAIPAHERRQSWAKEYGECLRCHSPAWPAHTLQVT